MKKRKIKINWKFVYLAIFVVVIGSGLFFCYNDHTIQATVVEKTTEMIKRGRGRAKPESVIYVRTKAGKKVRLANHDILIRTKEDCGEIASSLKVGRTYKFTVVGMKSGLSFTHLIEENIIKVEPVDKQK